MDRDQARSAVEFVSRVGTIALVLLYIGGFLVVSFANAMFGVVEYSLFRTRVLSAGVLLFVFLAFPILEASRALGLYGFPDPGIPRKLSDSKTSKFLRLCLAADQLLWFFNFAWVSVFIMQVFFGRFLASMPYLGMYMGFLALSVAAAMVIRWQFSRRPFLALVGLPSAILLGLAMLTLLKEWEPLLLLLWFLFIGELTRRASPFLDNLERLRDVSWQWVLLNMIAVVTFFTVGFYPKVLPVYGGGRPAKVIVQFVGASPIGNSKQTSVWLIDEASGGYYLIQKPGDTKAIFVPRNLVSAIYFEPEPSLW
jgi:hypothetical protein